jgi:hypothetical protein
MTQNDKLDTIIHQQAAMLSAVNSLISLLIDSAAEEEMEIEIDPDFPLDGERIQ